MEGNNQEASEIRIERVYSNREEFWESKICTSFEQLPITVPQELKLPRFCGEFIQFEYKKWLFALNLTSSYQFPKEFMSYRNVRKRVVNPVIDRATKRLDSITDLVEKCAELHHKGVLLGMSFDGTDGSYGHSTEDGWEVYDTSKEGLFRYMYYLRFISPKIISEPFLKLREIARCHMNYSQDETDLEYKPLKKFYVYDRTIRGALNHALTIFENSEVLREDISREDRKYYER